MRDGGIVEVGTVHDGKGGLAVGGRREEREERILWDRQWREGTQEGGPS